MATALTLHDFRTISVRINSGLPPRPHKRNRTIPVDNVNTYTVARSHLRCPKNRTENRRQYYCIYSPNIWKIQSINVKLNCKALLVINQFVDATIMHRIVKYELFFLFTNLLNFVIFMWTGDGMTRVHDDQAFTTKGADHDADADENCAETYHGAWWYGICHVDSNLNGLYNDGPQEGTNSFRNIIWIPWKGLHYTLKGSEMKIRPVN